MLLLNQNRISCYLISAQSFLNYVLLCLIFTTWLACRRTEEGTILTVFKKRGWKYFLLALVDVEGNYLIVKAYHYTTVTSVQVSSIWSGTIPEHRSFRQDYNRFVSVVTRLLELILNEYEAFFPPFTFEAYYILKKLQN